MQETGLNRLCTVSEGISLAALSPSPCVRVCSATNQTEIHVAVPLADRLQHLYLDVVSGSPSSAQQDRRSKDDSAPVTTVSVSPHVGRSCLVLVLTKTAAQAYSLNARHGSSVTAPSGCSIKNETSQPWQAVAWHPKQQHMVALASKAELQVLALHPDQGSSVPLARFHPPSFCKPSTVTACWTSDGSTLLVCWGSELEVLAWVGELTEDPATWKDVKRRKLLVGVGGPFRAMAATTFGGVLGTTDPPLAFSTLNASKPQDALKEARQQLPGPGDVQGEEEEGVIDLRGRWGETGEVANGLSSLLGGNSLPECCFLEAQAPPDPPATARLCVLWPGLATTGTHKPPNNSISHSDSIHTSPSYIPKLPSSTRSSAPFRPMPQTFSIFQTQHILETQQPQLSSNANSDSPFGPMHGPGASFLGSSNGYAALLSLPLPRPDLLYVCQETVVVGSSTGNPVACICGVSARNGLFALRCIQLTLPNLEPSRVRLQGLVLCASGSQHSPGCGYGEGQRQSTNGEGQRQSAPAACLASNIGNDGGIGGDGRIRGLVVGPPVNPMRCQASMDGVMALNGFGGGSGNGGLHGATGLGVAALRVNGTGLGVNGTGVLNDTGVLNRIGVLNGNVEVSEIKGLDVPGELHFLRDGLKGANGTAVLTTIAGMNHTVETVGKMRLDDYAPLDDYGPLDDHAPLDDYAALDGFIDEGLGGDKGLRGVQSCAGASVQEVAQQAQQLQLIGLVGVQASSHGYRPSLLRQGTPTIEFEELCLASCAIKSVSCDAHGAHGISCQVISACDGRSFDQVSRIGQDRRFDRDSQRSRIDHGQRSDQLDQAKRMDQVDQVNAIDQRDQVNQVDLVNKIDQLDQINKVDQVDPVNKIDQVDLVNKIDQVDQVNKVDQLANSLMELRTHVDAKMDDMNKQLKEQGEQMARLGNLLEQLIRVQGTAAGSVQGK